MYCTSDAILSHESEAANERILSLEKKVQQQDDEIVCLKSALADALRRVAALESGLCVMIFIIAIIIIVLIISIVQTNDDDGVSRRDDV